MIAAGRADGSAITLCRLWGSPVRHHPATWSEAGQGESEAVR